MLKFTPMRVLDEMKEQKARNQELATERMKQTQEELYENMGNDSISDKLDEHNKNIAKIADSAEKQANAAVELAVEAKNISSDSAKSSKTSKIVSIISVIISVLSFLIASLSVVLSALANADDIYTNFNKILSSLMH